MAKAAAKKKEPLSSHDKNRYNMKVVSSDTCQVCKQQCPRGIRYLEHMAKPGAVGHGVPCILTQGRAYK
ncbi:hypothetical protein [Gorillibacterium timonense]|uniref:hypothetical protein n=1 Tax=Gorillibacterium timonense TaxID=1689269 RepID=UPI00071CAB81|nr:hypothetical protein [Gorillibacterium timonense]